MRIIFVNLFEPELISGGIHVTYKCAELLQDNGYNAVVWQPGGPPTWMTTTARVISSNTTTFGENDILFFPEVFIPRFLRVLKQVPHLDKVLFCQSHINLFNNQVIPPATPGELGFKKILCVSHVSKDFIERVFSGESVAVMPVGIDPAMFRPAAKRLQIAFAPRKLRGHADLVRKIFFLKYPEMRHIPWKSIDHLPQAEVAGIMGHSAVYLALGQFESCPLMPLEAMSSGCIVVGYHGGGGLEYATHLNGFWHYQDEVEAVADDLYRAVNGIQNGDPDIAAMKAAGHATAARFNAGAMQEALVAVIQSLR